MRRLYSTLVPFVALVAFAACGPELPSTPVASAQAALVAPDSVVYVGTCVPVSGAVGCRIEGYAGNAAFTFANVTTWRMVAPRPTAVRDKIGFEFRAAYVYPAGNWKNFSPRFRWSYKQPNQTVNQSSYANWPTAGAPSGANLTYARVYP